MNASDRPSAQEGARASLVDRLRRLEGEIQQAQAALAALGGVALPGLYLLLRTSGRPALLAVTRVREVVRLVATRALPGAPEHVLGSFVCRGVPVIAVDLAAVLTRERRSPSLDAQIVVLAGAPAIGLVVDRIEALVESPQLFEGDAEVGTPAAWRGSALVAGLCVHDGEVVPLVDPTPLAEALREPQA